MAYSPPAVQVNQEFAAPAVAAFPALNPVIIGPRYDVLTYQADKATIALGAYDPSTTVKHSYPNLSATGIVDLANVLLYFDDAYLKYFEKLIADTTYQFRVITPHRNRIRAAADIDSSEPIFSTTTDRLGNTYTRSSNFLRDVLPGDGILVHAEIGGTDYSILTKVAELLHDIIPAVVGTPTADAGNEGVHSHSVGSPAADAGNTGDEVVAAGGTYTGDLASGVVEDTYTVEVTTGGNYATQTITQNNAIGTDTLVIDATSEWDHSSDEVYTIEIIQTGATGVAKMRYTSASGLDNGPVAGATVTFGAAIAIGSYGLVITLNDTTDSTLEAGSNWEITCTAGTAVLKITSDSGVDDVLSYKARTDGFAFPLGALGATFTLTDGGDTVLTLGDKWTVDCEAGFSLPGLTMGGTYTNDRDLVYTVEVTKGGVWGTCEITVTSTSTDSSGPSVVAVSTAVTFGTKGLTVTFAANTQGGLLLGDKWTVAATATLNGPTKSIRLQDDLPATIRTTAPTITGPTDVVAGPDDVVVDTSAYADNLNVLSERDKEVYIVEITKGGAVGVAEYSVTSQSGLDSTPTDQVIADFGTTAYAVGTQGLTVKFQDTDVSTDLTVGQQWAFEIEKTNLDVTLYIIKDDVSIPEYRVDTPADDAWQVESDGITIESNIYLTDSTWASGSTLVPLPVTQANQYVAYRALRPEDSDEIGTMDGNATDTTIEGLLGPIQPTNPISYGVKKAILNSGGADVRYMKLATDDTAGYSSALSRLQEDRASYAITPLTQSAAVHQLVIAHANSLSTSTENRWRIGLFNKALNTSIYLFEDYTDPVSGAESDYVATVEDDPLVSGTQYQLLIGDTAQGVNFLTSGVVVGDVVELGFSVDLNGELQWTDYTITDVRSETALTFTPALTSAITTPSKFRLRRVLSKQQQAEEIRDYAASLYNRRAMLVWPNIAGDGEYQVEGYFLAAAIAGLTAQHLPHQGFTNMQVLGFDDLSNSFLYFSRAQLNTIAEGGVTIVTQQIREGAPFIRHQLMTKMSGSLFDQEYSLVRVPDFISYYFYENFQDFIGLYNINTNILEEIEARALSIIDTLLSTDFPRIGTMINAGRVLSVAQHETYKDRVEVLVELVIPAPINDLVITLSFVL